MKLVKVSRTTLAHRTRGLGEFIEVTFGSDGRLLALRWPYETTDLGLYQMAKRRGAIWNPSQGGWVFDDPLRAQQVLDHYKSKHPDWPVVGDPSTPYLAYFRLRIAQQSIGSNLSVCLVSSCLPPFTDVPTTSATHFLLSFKGKHPDALALVGDPIEIADFVKAMKEQGAIHENLFTRYKLTIDDDPLRIQKTGWAVKILANLNNPWHWLAAPRFGAFDGVIHTTRKNWSLVRIQLDSVGLKYAGDCPERDDSSTSDLNPTFVPGWDVPAPNGHLMHPFQKKGVEFCLSRGMRALIGDEMGVGKTVQAIAAAEASEAPRVLIVCPANARFVWDREIKGWGGRGSIQHIFSQLETPDWTCRWHIVTYDVIASRTQSWRLNNEAEQKAVIDAFPEKIKEIDTSKAFPRKVTFLESSSNTPRFDDPKLLVAWEKMMSRLRNEIVQQFSVAGPMLIVLDEAHRVKNKAAKRSAAIQKLTGLQDSHVLLLTGTPIRNHEGEVAALLNHLDPSASSELSRSYGYSTQDTKDYLDFFMIRRTKAEVLPELPEKIRQRVDLDNLDESQIVQYRNWMDLAILEFSSVSANESRSKEARIRMLGHLEKARSALGLAKVKGGALRDLILSVVESKGCCVIFCAHHVVIDALHAQLEREGLSADFIDGRTPQKKRSEIVERFQAGLSDVLVAGIHAAGEAITLTRADTVIFVEFDWVPAALLQAEDRIHRVGQRSSCQVIQIVAKLQDEKNLDEIMIELLGVKMTRIGTILGEDTTNLVQASIQSEVQNFLIGETVPTKCNFDNATSKGKRRAKPSLEDLNPDEDDTLVLPKRPRGRPKVYTDSSPPSPGQRTKSSIAALEKAGGKRIMLRLTPQAYDALKFIMDKKHITQETATINDVLVQYRNSIDR